ncbi:uncharacterized protein BCR38DRAFT_474519 [Pseudomassariella vexata]|uniref:Nephrocystin 3-like N-terminal domain-containing protein n=1 Tax=Pseudomassariella vexata TaxID=1141098 RepID=A0A1Y2DXG9_9PEZI|nr:uncharacterized protein BCR38DRAFT_474519 [Pseudomassariella vexata]ORY63953.1 hypothetical protein BCR38DRAFT_474519 [Pseudomassariella vexata]
MTTESRTHDDYTVGWMCALPKEQTAATAMLDRRHADLPNPSTDHNIYTLGSIGNHNTVFDDNNEDEVGENCRRCDKAQIIKRTSRAIRVHYGLIASGNRVVKNAAFREQVNKDLGNKFLCVEMEAAGLMDNFPCIVIRGICDHADSHKNKDWQEHAAAVAAAFAKEVLGYVQPSDVAHEGAVKDQLRKEVSTIAQDVRHLCKSLSSEEDGEIMNWLTPIDYGTQQSDVLRRRQQGTGQWLINSYEYQTWLNTSKQTLFCPGIPGAGKTILTSIVIENLSTRFQNDQSIGIAYLYCNFRRQAEHNIKDLLSSLLRQLAQTQSSLRGSVKDLYDRHKAKRTRPSLEEILTAVQSFLTIYSRALLIVDALDECQLSNGCRFRLTHEILSLQTKTGANFLATSRSIPEIMENFDGVPSVHIRASEDDIHRYLDGQMSRVSRCVKRKTRWFPDAQLEITTVCTTYLSFQDFANGYSQNDEEFQQRFKSHPFYDYAAHNWGHHGRNSSTCQKILHVLQKQGQVEASSQALLAFKRGAWNPNFSQETPKQITGLHLAACFGLEEAVTDLWDIYYVDATDIGGRTPLSRAAEGGHEAVVRLLLEKGADIEAQDKEGWRPLLWAAEGVHEDVVRLLFEKGADIDALDNCGRMALSLAAEEGYEAIVQLLQLAQQTITQT